MEKSIVTTRRPKRITHIRNESNIPYEHDATDAISFDMVDSIINENMISSSISPIKKQINQIKNGDLLKQTGSQLPHESSTQSSHALKTAEAQFKKFAKKFPLMEKSQKVLKQLKHNRSIPKPRAHVASSSLDKSVPSPLNSFKTENTTKTSINSNLNQCDDQQQSILNKNSEVKSNLLNNYKSNSTNVFKTHAEESCTDKDSNYDTTDSEFEKFIEKNIPKSKKKRHKKKSKLSLKHNSYKLKKVKYSASENPQINSSSKGSSDMYTEKSLKHQSLSTNKKKTATKVSAKNKRQSNKNDPLGETREKEYNLSNELLDEESDVVNKTLENESTKCNSDSTNEKLKAKATLRKRDKLCSMNKQNISVEEYDSNCFDSSDDNSTSSFTINLPVEENMGNTARKISLCNDLRQNKSSIQKMIPVVLISDSLRNENFDVEVPIKISDLKGISSVSNSSNAENNSNPDLESKSSGVYNDKSLHNLISPSNVDFSSSSNGQSSSSHNSGKDFIPFEEAREYKNCSIEQPCNSESDESDIEIIAVVKKENILPRDNFSVCSSSFQLKEPLEVSINDDKVGFKTSSNEVIQSSTGLNLLECKTEILSSKSDKIQISDSSTKDYSVIEPGITEKHNPVYMTNICQDFLPNTAEQVGYSQSCANSENFKSDTNLVLEINDGRNTVRNSSNTYFANEKNVSLEDGDINIDYSHTCSVKQEKQDDDIVIEFVKKAPPKRNCVTDCKVNFKRKSDDLGKSDCQLPAKVSKISSHHIGSFIEKDSSLFDSLSHSDPKDSDTERTVVGNPSSLQELITCYKKEVNIYEEILKSGSNIEASIRLLEARQAKRLKEIRSLIKECVKCDPSFDKISNGTIKRDEQEHGGFGSGPTPRIDVHEISSSLPCVSHSMSNANSNASNLPTAPVKMENESMSTENRTSSVSTLGYSNLVCKSEAVVGSCGNSPAPGKQELNFLGQKCAFCGKNAIAACQRCAKVFFCSDTCGKNFWDERHKDECVK